MINKKHRAITFFISTFLVGNPAFSAKLKKKDYIQSQAEKAVVLFDVSWGRKWACGQFHNAQLTHLAFEKTGVKETDHTKYSKINIETPSKAFAKPKFINYGFLVEPGEYIFSGWSVKAAKSTTDVGYFKADKNDLTSEDGVFAGSFNVKKGETIFIGLFFLDCYESPIPWRYYPDGKESFEILKNKYSKKYKFLNKDDIQFRLLKTTSFGQPYELPK